MNTLFFRHFFYSLLRVKKKILLRQKKKSVK
jgi:hypothetical protein